MRIEIVHFKEKKLSSKLELSSHPPKVTEKGFTKPGGAFLRTQIEGKSMHLSYSELCTLKQRIETMLFELCVDEGRLQDELDKDWRDKHPPKQESNNRWDR
jgi:hypothetical protein